MNSTEEEDAWASATTSPTAEVPVTSEGKSVTPFADASECLENNERESPESPPLTSLAQSATGESRVTSFADKRNSVTSFASAKDYLKNTRRESSELPRVTSFSAPRSFGAGQSAVESRVTSFTNDGNPLLDNRVSQEMNINGSAKFSESEDFKVRKRFPATKRTGNNECAESPVGHCTPTTSGLSEINGSSYPKIESQLRKLILRVENEDLPILLHRVKIPTVADELAELAGMPKVNSTTTDYSMVSMHDSMPEVSTPRDTVDRVGDLTKASEHDVTADPPEKNSTAFENDSSLDTGKHLINFTLIIV